MTWLLSWPSLSWLFAYWQWVLIGAVVVVGSLALAWFLRNWRFAAVGIVIVLAAVGGQAIDQAGFKRAAALCNEARLRGELARANEQLAKANADLRIAAFAAASEKKRGEELDTIAKQNEERNRALEEEVAKRPADQRCRATDDDIKRLRQR